MEQLLNKIDKISKFLKLKNIDYLFSTFDWLGIFLNYSDFLSLKKAVFLYATNLSAECR